MTRVSLKEAYDNKDVVAQIYAVRDIAEGAEDTANNASASAQASAQTVAGYENRLSTVESDLNAVTLRVTTAEGQIVTIQGRVTALETADGQNVKLSGDQNISGIKTVPTEATGSLSQQIANSAKIGAELDNYSQMVRTTGNQSIAGGKTFPGTISSSRNFDVTVAPGSTLNLAYAINQVDMNGVQVFNIWAQQLLDGKINVYLGVRNKDGTQKNVLLGASD